MNAIPVQGTAEDLLEAEPAPPGEAVNILLVDDKPSNLVALEGVLDDLGANLVTARSGTEALRHVLKNDFALILMDVRMPGMDGFETAALIRGRERSRHIPIIFLTAFDANDVEVFKGYSLGAVDFLYKPIVPAILRSKVSALVEIFKKAEQIKRRAELLRELEQQEHARQLAEAKERLQAERLRREVLVAGRIQQRLFPAGTLQVPGFDIAGASYPAEAAGGDYFDYIPMQDGCLGLVVADVSGHGFGPALLMAETRAYLRAFALTCSDVGEMVGFANRALAADVADEHFVTLLLARLDPRSRALVHASAGHTSGYVLDPSGAVRALLDSTGPPLGIMPEATFPARPALTLGPGEIALLLTDGILEACSPGGELFGKERVLSVLRANRDRSAREIVAALHAAVVAFCQEGPLADDVTLIVARASGMKG
jgi:serine phosphatase RsbU (regulator of sigma subunit)